MRKVAGGPSRSSNTPSVSVSPRSTTSKQQRSTLSLSTAAATSGRGSSSPLPAQTDVYDFQDENDDVLGSPSPGGPPGTRPIPPLPHALPHRRPWSEEVELGSGPTGGVGKETTPPPRLLKGVVRGQQAKGGGGGGKERGSGASTTTSSLSPGAVSPPRPPARPPLPPIPPSGGISFLRSIKETLKVTPSRIMQRNQYPPGSGSGSELSPRPSGGGTGSPEKVEPVVSGGASTTSVSGKLKEEEKSWRVVIPVTDFTATSTSSSPTTGGPVVTSAAQSSPGLAVVGRSSTQQLLVPVSLPSSTQRGGPSSVPSAVPPSVLSPTPAQVTPIPTVPTRMPTPPSTAMLSPLSDPGDAPVKKREPPTTTTLPAYAAKTKVREGRGIATQELDSGWFKEGTSFARLSRPDELLTNKFVCNLAASKLLASWRLLSDFFPVF